MHPVDDLLHLFGGERLPSGDGVTDLYETADGVTHRREFFVAAWMACLFALDLVDTALVLLRQEVHVGDQAEEQQEHSETGKPFDERRAPAVVVADRAHRFGPSLVKSGNDNIAP